MRRAWLVVMVAVPSAAMAVTWPSWTVLDDKRVPTSWWATCTGCRWTYGLSNDEDDLIDAHETHRKEQP